uniref:Uncharacterized protein n=1 Tax=Rhizophora mucronata TaxID=61149 RepID=A0A2P2QMW3_RHIMU
MSCFAFMLSLSSNHHSLQNLLISVGLLMTITTVLAILISPWSIHFIIQKG